MPDCAHATLYLWPLPDLREPDPSGIDEADEAAYAEWEKLEPLRSALLAMDVDPDTFEPNSDFYEGELEIATLEDGSRRLTVSVYDAPWGTNWEPVAEACEAARQLGIAFLAQDGGHYTWDPYAEFWRPGMDEVETITEGLEGDTRMSWSDFDVLRKRCSDGGSGADGTVDYLALGRAVAGHFERNPLDWRPAPSEVSA